ncbi:serine carboxypeptidase-like 17 isoform X2 [Olea europaea var. sylvestris]|uniref:serine carboxypeptidase-like 17 isoform X2 n=1 Tax=Olea europaea var. sylvestris TaxID=158386 RepID=UPI000C1D24A8|nr:serine carboxypeptidase-like 17 isoform X2 [Olea europaea var. sylvestris]
MVVNKMNWIGLPALLLLLLFNTGTSQSIIKTLPGYSGTLPFKLETGYIGVGENDEVQLFYYFVESENNPKTDPLIFWISGGPGCSGLSTLVYETVCFCTGPFYYDVADFDGSLPSILPNPYSWTKVASIIFIDSPVGTGFSYANTSKGYSSSDKKSAKDNYTFLRKWLLNHPMLSKNRLYVAGESYGGKLVPMVAMEILLGNEAGLRPRMSLQGYIIGNGLTDPNIDYNERIPIAHRLALISDEYFELAKVSCGGKYDNPDPNNVQCLLALQPIKECVNQINEGHILEPKCKRLPKTDNFGWDLTFSKDDSVDHLVLQVSKQDRQWCRSQNYESCYVWANDLTVQEALRIRKGTIGEWMRCNRSISYEVNQKSVLHYHEIFSNKGYNVLIYNGDHDLLIPYMGPLKWIRNLSMTIDDDWRPWHVNGQVAGYTMKHKKNEFNLTFVTVKGAGHTPPEYKPKECLAMIHRWLSTRLL